MNLLKETKEVLTRNGYNSSDIIFIGSRDGEWEMSWDDFEILADKEYSCGFGRQDVACDLIVVLSDGGRMHRAEYDGSEWWVTTRPFIKSPSPKKITKLFSFDSEEGWSGSLTNLHE
jgi:hypothetical protein